MPIIDADNGPEISDAEAIYSAMAAVFADSKQETVMQAALAVQQGTEWGQLPPAVRALFEDIADELFEDDEDGDTVEED